MHKVGRVSLVTTCNMLSQVVALFGFIFITRNFSPEFLSPYIIYLSLLAILSILSTCFYEQVLFIENDPGVHPVLTSYVIVLSLSICAATLFCLSLFKGGEEAILISIAMFGSGIKIISRNYAILDNRLVALSLLEVLAAFIVPFTILLLNHLGYIERAEHMIMVHSLLNFLVAIVFFLQFVPSVQDIFKRKITIREAYHFLKRYKKQLIYKTPSEFIGIAYTRAPVFIIDMFFSKTMATLYGVSLRIVITPVLFLTSTASQYFIVGFNKHKSNPNYINQNFKKFVYILFGVASLVCLVAYACVEFAISLLFPPEYYEMSSLVKAFIPYLFALISISPITMVFIIYEEQNKLFWANCTILLITILTYMLAVHFENLIFGIFSYSICFLLVYAYLLFLALQTLKKKLPNSHDL